MEYQQLGPRRLRVALTREELEELGLSYDALDYRDLRTRSLLLTLLETARGAVEFEAWRWPPRGRAAAKSAFRGWAGAAPSGGRCGVMSPRPSSTPLTTSTP